MWQEKCKGAQHAAEWNLRSCSKWAVWSCCHCGTGWPSIPLFPPVKCAPGQTWLPQPSPVPFTSRGLWEVVGKIAESSFESHAQSAISTETKMWQRGAMSSLSWSAQPVPHLGSHGVSTKLTFVFLYFVLNFKISFLFYLNSPCQKLSLIPISIWFGFSPGFSG